MKKFILTLLFSVLFITGCKCDRGLILFNSQPITRDSLLNNDKVFSTGQKVYYIFLAPKKMYSEFIRVQVFKMTDKAPWGGNEVVRTKDYRLMKDERYYHTDYFTFYESGRYVMQIFLHENFKTPIAICDFYVK